MKLVRFEDPTSGLGPFAHPLCAGDVPLIPLTDDRYAAVNVNTLRRFFPTCYRRLKRTFLIAVYDVDPKYTRRTNNPGEVVFDVTKAVRRGLA